MSEQLSNLPKADFIALVHKQLRFASSHIQILKLDQYKAVNLVFLERDATLRKIALSESKSEAGHAKCYASYTKWLAEAISSFDGEEVLFKKHLGRAAFEHLRDIAKNLRDLARHCFGAAYGFQYDNASLQTVIDKARADIEQMCGDQLVIHILRNNVLTLPRAGGFVPAINEYLFFLNEQIENIDRAVATSSAGHEELIEDSKRVYVLRLTREPICKGELNMPEGERNRGKKALFYIEIRKFKNTEKAARELSAMEDMLREMGWENDTCPIYNEGISCGFWMSPDDIPSFRQAYNECKARLQAHMDSLPSARPEEPDDVDPMFITYAPQFAKQTVFKSRNASGNCFTVYKRKVLAANDVSGTYTHVNFMKRDFFQAHALSFDILPEQEITMLPDMSYDLAWDTPSTFLEAQLFRPAPDAKEFKAFRKAIAVFADTNIIPTFQADGEGIVAHWQIEGNPLSLRVYTGKFIREAIQIGNTMLSEMLVRMNEEHDAERAAS
ncbi:TPA: DUF5417 domain-containing protein [Enterobacter hormaechei subsp. xiangfangensis]|nr:DUF5417 domain-containing protein [Enterobacter hormaechei subsp. xiangfangensis]